MWIGGIGEVMNFCEAPILSSLKAPPKKSCKNYSLCQSSISRMAITGWPPRVPVFGPNVTRTLNAPKELNDANDNNTAA